jgi:hypothetical protein
LQSFRVVGFTVYKTSLQHALQQVANKQNTTIKKCLKINAGGVPERLKGADCKSPRNTIKINNLALELPQNRINKINGLQGRCNEPSTTLTGK